MVNDSSSDVDVLAYYLHEKRILSIRRFEIKNIYYGAVQLFPKRTAMPFLFSLRDDNPG